VRPMATAPWTGELIHHLKLTQPLSDASYPSYLGLWVRRWWVIFVPSLCEFFGPCFSCQLCSTLLGSVKTIDYRCADKRKVRELECDISAIC
jgi:hypothetical protein